MGRHSGTGSVAQHEPGGLLQVLCMQSAVTAMYIYYSSCTVIRFAITMNQYCICIAVVLAYFSVRVWYYYIA